MLEKFSEYGLRRWSVSVRWRDRKCKICGTKTNLEAHHVNDKTHHPKQAYDIANGITLCKRCHIFFHTKFMGSFKKKCTFANYKKFLIIVHWVRVIENENENKKTNTNINN